MHGRTERFGWVVRGKQEPKRANSAKRYITYLYTYAYREKEGEVYVICLYM